MAEEESPSPARVPQGTGGESSSDLKGKVFLEVFAGCSSGMKEARKRRMRHVGVDVMPSFFNGTKRIKTKVVLDLLTVPGAKWIGVICEMAGVREEDVAVVWLSPPCNTFSKADACNESKKGKGKHCAYRDHHTEERHAVDWRSAGTRFDKDVGKWAEGMWAGGAKTRTYYGDMARRGDRLVAGSIAAVRSLAPGVIWMIENPAGSLRKRHYMQKMVKWMHTINYCVYGGLTWKETNIWTNAKWKPKGTKGGDGEGKCNSKGRCTVGRQGKRAQDWIHDHGIAGAGAKGVKGKGKKALINAVPADLMTEIIG